MELSRRRATALLGLGLLGTGLAAATPLPAAAAAPVSGDEFCVALLVGINKVRTERGLKPLARDPKLTAAARHAAEIMAEHRLMEHEIPGTPDFGARLRRARARARTGGENILRDNLGRYGLGCAAVGPDLPARLAREVATVSVPRWVGSPKHLDNILNPRFRRAGAAFAIVAEAPGCGQVYVAQVFAG